MSLPGSARRQRISRVADQHAGAAVCPLPVEPLQVDVREQGEPNVVLVDLKLRDSPGVSGP